MSNGTPYFPDASIMAANVATGSPPLVRIMLTWAAVALTTGSVGPTPAATSEAGSATRLQVASCQMIIVPSEILQRSISHQAPGTPDTSISAATVSSLVAVEGYV